MFRNLKTLGASLIALCLSSCGLATNPFINSAHSNPFTSADEPQTSQIGPVNESQPSSSATTSVDLPAKSHELSSEANSSEPDPAEIHFDGMYFDSTATEIFMSVKGRYSGFGMSDFLDGGFWISWVNLDTNDKRPASRFEFSFIDESYFEFFAYMTDLEVGRYAPCYTISDWPESPITIEHFENDGLSFFNRTFEYSITNEEGWEVRITVSESENSFPNRIIQGIDFHEREEKLYLRVYGTYEGGLQEMDAINNSDATLVLKSAGSSSNLSDGRIIEASDGDFSLYFPLWIGNIGSFEILFGWNGQLMLGLNYISSEEHGVGRISYEAGLFEYILIAENAWSLEYKYNDTVYQEEDFTLIYNEADIVTGNDGGPHLRITGNFAGIDAATFLAKPRYFDFQGHPDHSCAQGVESDAHIFYPEIEMWGYTDYTMDIDISTLASGAYSAHCAWKEIEDGTQSSYNLNMTVSFDKTVEINGTTYRLVSERKNPDSETFWGSLGLIVSPTLDGGELL